MKKTALSILMTVALNIPMVVVVVAPASAVSPSAPKILLLGDSYISGNGSRDEKGNRTEFGPMDCGRSWSNWSELGARREDTPSSIMHVLALQ
jgi:hypothetical protein